jgi:hypothetical protein
MKKAMGLVFLASLLSACATTGTQTTDIQTSEARSAVENWSSASKLAALKLIQEYGPPDRIDDGSLVWTNTGPWSRTEVLNLTSSPDIIEQSVSYQVPNDERAALADFSDKLHVSEDGWQLSVRGASEAENFLTINLAAEIIKGYTKPDEARRDFAKTMDLRASGKSSSLTEGLLFPPES